MAQPFDGTDWGSDAEQAWTPDAVGQDEAVPEPVADQAPVGRGRPLLAGLLILLGLGWLVTCGFAFSQSADTSLPALTGWIGTASVPLALLALIWLMFGRTSRAETERFSRSVASMRREADSLDAVLAIVADRLAANSDSLSQEAARLMKLGEEAADRLGRVTHYLSREGAELDRKAQALDAAAAQARLDLGVLLADLPQAEQAARTFSETLREAGITAHERAGSLEAQLSAIAARAQDADMVVGGAAERLGAHIARIDSSSRVAGDQLEQSAARLDAAVDGALGRTREAVETTRAALDTQAEATFAAIEQSRARFLEAGGDASRQLAERLAAVQQLVDRIDAGLAAQAETSQLLAARIGADTESLDQNLAAFGRRAESQSAQLATALAELRDSTATLRQEVDASTQEAAAMVGQAREMGGALDSVRMRLADELPSALNEVEARANATRDAALAAVEPVQAVQLAAADGAARLAEAEASLARQRQALDALLGEIERGAGGIEERLGAIAAAAGEADQAAAQLVRETGPELVEALVRVRESARLAAANAREAVTAAIPASAEGFADAVRQAVDAAVGEAVRGQIGELEAVSERAAAAARSASERLTRQLLTLGESAGALEAKIEEERQDREEHERGGMARRVALLIESLNSTAIDVTKILSNDVTDSAWSAYLKGDRGVFTRRAVRLLDSGEAREVLRHYDQELEFREQVNRYIADFEAMLRRVLADSDGNALAVALLSSDMGKLYVALAQAIQHLRV